MTVKVLIGTMEGFTSSVGVQVGTAHLLHRNLHWMSGDGKRQAIADVLRFCNALQVAGFTVKGKERLAELAELAEIDKRLRDEGPAK